MNGLVRGRGVAGQPGGGKATRSSAAMIVGDGSHDQLVVGKAI